MSSGNQRSYFSILTLICLCIPNPCCSTCPCRDTEDELMTVADEKDRLAPQVEEAKWRSRQLEKELQEAQEGRQA